MNIYIISCIFTTQRERKKYNFEKNLIGNIPTFSSFECQLDEGSRVPRHRVPRDVFNPLDISFILTQNCDF